LSKYLRQAGDSNARPTPFVPQDLDVIEKAFAATPPGAAGATS